MEESLDNLWENAEGQCRDVGFEDNSLRIFM